MMSDEESSKRRQRDIYIERRKQRVRQKTVISISIQIWITVKKCANMFFAHVNEIPVSWSDETKSEVLRSPDICKGKHANLLFNTG